VTRGEVEAIILPHSDPTEFDALLQRRTTCRNFDDSRALPLPLFTRMLGRVFGAQSQVKVGTDLVFHKKTSPSGGGLHPIEAYLIVQNVEGLPPGLYRYLADSHQLVPLPEPTQSLEDFIMECVGQQHWFANAHCLVAMVPRFDRTFWKYRRHAKGYRVVTLEAGHLSQTLYLSATDLGLGAFITGAINEKHLERGFGLDPIQQGALAVCGFGWRSTRMLTAELDPLEQVWERAD
jgi:putative peptide maturation dehydrogenase